jgi:hypothetical protein
MESSQFITEYPSIVFALSSFQTEKNIEDLQALVESLSLVYLTSMDKRIDLTSISHLLFAWTETGVINEGMI